MYGGWWMVVHKIGTVVVVSLVTLVTPKPFNGTQHRAMLTAFNYNAFPCHAVQGFRLYHV